LNRANKYRDLAETYLYASDFNTGLAILARCLKADPTDVWTYNILGLSLPHVGLSDLAVEVLDQALKRKAENDPEGLKQQFKDLHQEAVEKAARDQSHLQTVDPAVLADLRTAMHASASPLDSMNAYLPPIDQLITAHVDVPDLLYAEIIAQGKVLAPDLIRLAFDEAHHDTLGPRHAVALLRQLQVNNAVELGELKPWLDRADGNWPVDLLTNRMGKIGGYTTTELESIAADTGYYLFVRSGATDALVERVQKCPEQRERIVNFMRMLLTRPEASKLAAEETFLGFLISDILDLEARELYPEIEAAYQEDRVDTTIVDLAFIQEKWGLQVSSLAKRRDDGFYLPLHCTECDRVREHFVQHVTVDLGSQKKKQAGQPVIYDPHIMDREIICPKCGSRDQYELTPQASLRLMIPTAGPESFMAIFQGEKAKSHFKPHPRVHYFESLVFGRPMHPLVGLDKYKELIAADPKDVTLRMRMGNLLRTLHRYPQALEAFRQGYELGTDNPEYILTRAMAEHDFGDRAIARNLYEETIALAAQQSTLKSYMLELVQTARRGLKLLQRGKASPWEPDVAQGSSSSARQPQPSPSRRPKRQKKRIKTRSKKKKRKRKR
jgi:tetratricopeptide (TPR) repeat protein